MAQINYEHRAQTRSLGVPAHREEAHSQFAKGIGKTLEDTAHCYILTLIPEDGQIPYDKLNYFEFLKFKLRHHKKIARWLPKDVRAMGAIDVCLRYLQNVRGEWAFHFHFVITRMLTQKELKVLKKAYPNNRDKGIYVAVKQVKIKDGEEDLITSAGYTLKHYFTRSSKFTTSSATRNDYLNTKSIPLDADESRILDEYFAPFSTTAPILLIGYKMKRTSSPTLFSFMETNRK